jgi:hypothetical protein
MNLVAPLWSLNYNWVSLSTAPGYSLHWFIHISIAHYYAVDYPVTEQDYGL